MGFHGAMEFLHKLFRRRSGFAVFFLVSVSLAAGREGPDEQTLLLTWKKDPATTMTIQCLEVAENEAPALSLTYWKEGAAERETVEAETVKLLEWDEECYRHRVTLENLDPDSLYRFQLGGEGRVFAFRTMPSELTRPIRIAVGGDTLHEREWMEAVNRQAMRYDPDFIVWGGDLAYADGLKENLPRWRLWFDVNAETLIDEDGRIVPIVVAIGNHEVRKGMFYRHEDYEQTDEWRLKLAPYFYQLFAFPDLPGYGALDFGDYLSIIVLDTVGTNPIHGEQTEWLAQALEERSHFRHVMPVYHIPAYPSVRLPEQQVEGKFIRETWLPLFDRHENIRVAFENHDHAYKRTPPIRGDKPDPKGIVYVGDGAWGVGVRPVHPADETWYLERSEPLRHAIIVTVDGDSLGFEVVGEEGDIIDQFRIE